MLLLLKQTFLFIVSFLSLFVSCHGTSFLGPFMCGCILSPGNAFNLSSHSQTAVFTRNISSATRGWTGITKPFFT